MPTTCQGSKLVGLTRRSFRNPVLAIARTTPPILTESVVSTSTTAIRSNHSGGRQLSSNAIDSSRRLTGSWGLRRAKRDDLYVNRPIETRLLGGYPPASMVYPRKCPSCGRDEPSPEQLYSTRAASDGGTPSPWR